MLWFVNCVLERHHSLPGIETELALQWMPFKRNQRTFRNLMLLITVMISVRTGRHCLPSDNKCAGCGRQSLGFQLVFARRATLLSSDTHLFPFCSPHEYTAKSGTSWPRRKTDSGGCISNDHPTYFFDYSPFLYHVSPHMCLFTHVLLNIYCNQTFLHRICCI